MSVKNQSTFAEFLLSVSEVVCPDASWRRIFPKFQLTCCCGKASSMMQSHAPAAARKPASFFHRNGLLSQLISVLLAWTMVMSSLPVYATDQPRAAWVDSSGFDGALTATWPRKTSSVPG